MRILFHGFKFLTLSLAFALLLATLGGGIVGWAALFLAVLWPL